MMAGAPGWGAHSDPPSCGAASGPPVLLLALLGLLSVPVARGEYGEVGRSRDTCLDPSWLGPFCLDPSCLGPTCLVPTWLGPSWLGGVWGWGGGRGQGRGSSSEEVFSCRR